MFKTLKILCICLILISSFYIISYATEEDYIEEDENSSITDATAYSDTSDVSEPSTNEINKISSISSLPEADLGLNNILNILLIAIGFLIILLAIAILIRLKHM